MVFFQDDEQVPNEASSGQVAGISLYPYALGPQQAQRCAQLALAPTPIGQDVDGRLLTTPEPLLQSVVDGRQGPPPHPGCSACQPLEFVQHEEAPELPEASPVLLVEALPVVAYESYPALPPLPEPDEALPQPAQPLAEVAEAKPAEPAVEWAFYPNPATLGVWVRGANPNLPLHATLRDAAGREVPGLAVQPHGAAAYVAWPAETARGHYFLTVSQGNHTHTQRIVLH
jgi:hypothetical protein